MIEKIKKFFGEFKTELSKVSWSTRQELIGSTSVVIVLTGMLAVFIFAVDYLLAHFLKIIFKA